jgi:drug/metabolite transporter (DMT)-like permease
MRSSAVLVSGNATVLLTLTTLIWGGNAVAGKFAIGEISPFLLTAARWVIAAIILMAFAHRRLRRDWPVIKIRLSYLFLMGACGFAGFNGLLYSSLQYTTAINVTIIQAGMPMFIFVMNFLLFRIRVHWAQVAGYSLTLIGVLVTAVAGDFTQLAALAINRGDAIMLGAAFVYALYSVFLGSKPQMHWLSFLTVLIVSAAVTALFMAGHEIATNRVIWPTSVTAWTVVFYTALLPSIVAQGFFIRGVELIGGNKAGMFLNLVPIFGAFLAVLLLGEAFQLYHAAAIALVISGIFMAQRLGRAG